MSLGDLTPVSKYLEGLPNPSVDGTLEPWVRDSIHSMNNPDIPPANTADEIIAGIREGRVPSLDHVRAAGTVEDAERVLGEIDLHPAIAELFYSEAEKEYQDKIATKEFGQEA